MQSSAKPSEARPCRAKLGQPREARPPPKAAGAVRRPGAEGDPRASRGLQTNSRGVQIRSEKTATESNTDECFSGFVGTARSGFQVFFALGGKPPRKGYRHLYC